MSIDASTMDKVNCTNSHEVPDFPWFGIDVGGTLVKLVYFEPLDLTEEEEKKEGDVLKTIKHYLTSNTAYGDTGVRDYQLELKGIKVGNHTGNLHFIRFPTQDMEAFIDLCVSRKLHTLTFQVFATGGGAYKFESVVTERLNIKWNKCDELDTLMRGIQFLNKINLNNECYYYDIQIHNNERKFTKKNFLFSNSFYPFIVVNIGSGVSILLVNSENSYKRISGTSIGGGTFLGLCCLLTGCHTYEEAISLATKGDSTKVDKLVRDIYGGDYSRFGLPGDIVASSFGHMNCEDKRQQVSREDLARATLVTTLNNIGLIARDCAANYKIERVLYVGTFLRINHLSMELLSYATDYWSKGSVKSLFLEHEIVLNFALFFCFRVENFLTTRKMDSFGIPLIIVSLFWFIVGGVLPFFAKGPNRDIIRVMLILSSVCCYTFWLCTYLHQYRPIFGPQLTNETAKILQNVWGNKF